MTQLWITSTSGPMVTSSSGTSTRPRTWDPSTSRPPIAGLSGSPPDGARPSRLFPDRRTTVALGGGGLFETAGVVPDLGVRVLVGAPPPHAALVPAEGGGVEPLVHAPQTI